MSELTFAAVDVGGTKIAAAIGRADGTIVAQSAIATDSHDGAETVLARLSSLVRDLAALSGATPSALGLGVPGLVDVASGTTRFLPNMTGEWRDVPVRKLLEPQVDCPVAVMNDARLATLGELTYGHGRKARSLVCLTLGTGIGGGIAIDGVLRLGPFGSAGEIGHQTLRADGPLCTCGNRGCLEALASGPAIASRGMYLLQCGRAPILREIVNGDIGAVTPREMALAAERGEATVRDELVRAFEYIGIGVANAVTMVHPDVVVLSGGLTEVGPLLFDTVRKVVQKRVRMFPPANVRIEKSLVTENAALVGGLALAAQTALERGTLGP